jgi:Short repeat of unknown function (DUF308)
MVEMVEMVVLRGWTVRRWAERAGAWTSWIGGMVRTWSWRAVLVLGVVTILLGVALTLSPIAALTRLTLVTALAFIVSGFADIVSDAADEGRASPRLVGYVWIVFGSRCSPSTRRRPSWCWWEGSSWPAPD